MIDSFVLARNNIEMLDVSSGLGCTKGEFGLVTLHRPSNFDNGDGLARLCEHLVAISKKIPLLFPVHPRTLGKLKAFGIVSLNEAENIHLTDPLGYNDFMNLVFKSKLISTD